MLVEVRLVGPEEHGVAGEIVLSSYEALPGAHMSGGYAAELVDVGGRAKDCQVLVALAPGLVGCVTLVLDPTSFWAEGLGPGEAGLRMMAVRPEAQGKGVGRALLAECIARAQQAGCSAVTLHSTPWMHAAHHHYQSTGFYRVPERDWLPVPEVPLLAFRKDLTIT